MDPQGRGAASGWDYVKGLQAAGAQGEHGRLCSCCCRLCCLHSAAGAPPAGGTAPGAAAAAGDAAAAVGASLLLLLLLLPPPPAALQAEALVLSLSQQQLLTSGADCIPSLRGLPSLLLRSDADAFASENVKSAEGGRGEAAFSVAKVDPVTGEVAGVFVTRRLSGRSRAQRGAACTSCL